MSLSDHCKNFLIIRHFVLFVCIHLHYLLKTNSPSASMYNKLPSKYHENLSYLTLNFAGELLSIFEDEYVL